MKHHPLLAPVNRRRAIRTLAGATVGGMLRLDVEASLQPGLCGGGNDVEGFKPHCFTDSSGAPHQVYVIGTGPPVLLLHELPGLVDDDLKTARRVADLGYAVVAPLFFGKAGLEASVWTTVLNTLRVCDEKEFACGSGEKTSPHVGWLRELSRAIRKEWPDGRGVGVIGMCLTGAFPVALLQEPAVVAAVLCQPTLPFNAGTRFGWFTDDNALGLDPTDLEKAKKNSQAPILGIRYTEDWRCRPPRFQRLTREFGTRFYRIDVVGDGHSTLASAFCPDAFREVSAFLNQYVRTSASPPAFPILAKNNSLDEVRVTTCDPSSPHA